uniref:Uncharacterized protein n=1 Tax=Oryza punctata TaxID=4537 RepID=A0A0E0LSM8_ORYPU
MAPPRTKISLGQHKTKITKRDKQASKRTCNNQPRRGQSEVDSEDGHNHKDAASLLLVVGSHGEPPLPSLSLLTTTLLLFTSTTSQQHMQEKGREEFVLAPPVYSHKGCSGGGERGSGRRRGTARDDDRLLI